MVETVEGLSSRIERLVGSSSRLNGQEELL